MIPLLLASIGCYGKQEPTTGEEFYRTFAHALRRKDVDTIWKLMSEECRAHMATYAECRIRAAESTEEFNQFVEDSADEQPVPEIPTREPRELAKHMIREWIETHWDLVGAMRYVETIQTETPLGMMTSVVFRYPGVDRDMMVLMEVDGFLRMWSCKRFLSLNSTGSSVASAEE